MPLEKAPLVAVKDILWRVDGKPSKNNTARFVPYVDATTTAALLDEWVGPGNWSDSYENRLLAGKEALECSLSIKVGDEWVTKRDVGVASNFEAQKGMVSDAFKRVACIKWGVARNVYSLPTLWAPCDTWTDNKGNQQARANDKTLPAIHKELKKLGYEASGKLSAQDSGTDTDNEGTATPVSVPEKSSGGATPSQTSKPQTGAEVSPEPVADEPAKAGPKTDAGDGSGAGGAVSPPQSEMEGSQGPSSLDLINEAVADKRVKPNTLKIVANRVALAHDAIPDGGISTQTIEQLPTEVLDEIAAELHLRQGALV